MYWVCQLLTFHGSAGKERLCMNFLSVTHDLIIYSCLTVVEGKSTQRMDALPSYFAANSNDTEEMQPVMT